jgi:hypothetical protein
MDHTQKSGGAPSRAHRQSKSSSKQNGKYNETAGGSRRAYGTEHAAPTPDQVAAHNLAVALTWAQAGFHVHPCYGSGAKVKEPRIRWKDEATTDAAVIRAWWKKWPFSLPAIVLGDAGLVVIDPDRHGGPDGVAEWRRICAERNWTDGAQPAVTTSGDGEHIFFRQPLDGPRLGNADRALKDKGINVRGDGGYVIAPGAMLPDGRKWRTREGSASLLDAYKAGTIPPVPDWLVKILTTRKAPKQPKSETPQPKGVIGPREKAYAARALEENAAELAATQEGGRNNVLNGVAYRMGRMIGAGWIDRNEVEGELEHACIKNGLKPVSEDWNGDPNEFETTLKSGIEAGMRQSIETLPNGFDASRYFEAREVFEQDGNLVDKETGEILGSANKEQSPDESKNDSEGPSTSEGDDGASDYAEEILKLPGLVSDIANWVLNVAQVPQPRFAVAAALTVVSAAAARHLLTPTMSALNMYLLMIAKTANGKDAPQAAVKNLLVKAGLRETLGPSGGNSDVGILLHCYKHPVTVMVIDEFGDVLAANNAPNASSHAQKIGAVYKIMWSGGQISLPAAASREHLTLDDPFLALLCAATPAQFFDAISGKQVADGMLNRFLGIFAPEGLAPFNENEGDVNDPPQELARRLRQLADRPGAPDPKRFRRRKPKSDDNDEETQAAASTQDAYAVPWGAGAQALYKAYRNEQRLKIDADNRRETLGPRLAHNAIKLATILAISEDPERPVVHPRHMRLGISLAEASFRDMTQGFDTHMPDSKTADMQDKLLRRVRNSPGGKIGRVELYRSVRRGFDGLNAYETTLQILLASGLIMTFDETPKNGGPTKTWLKATRAPEA